MQKDLCATTYRNGTPLTKQVELGKGAGYFKPEKMKYTSIMEKLY